MNNNKIVNQVLQTNVHSIFKRQKGNRPINKNHLDRLKLSMKKKYLEQEARLKISTIIKKDIKSMKLIMIL